MLRKTIVDGVQRRSVGVETLLLRGAGVAGVQRWCVVAGAITQVAGAWSSLGASHSGI
jgi:hypothetical protein